MFAAFPIHNSFVDRIYLHTTWSMVVVIIRDFTRMLQTPTLYILFIAAPFENNQHVSRCVNGRSKV